MIDKGCHFSLTLKIKLIGNKWILKWKLTHAREVRSRKCFVELGPKSRLNESLTTDAGPRLNRGKGEEDDDHSTYSWKRYHFQLWTSTEKKLSQVWLISETPGFQNSIVQIPIFSSLHQIPTLCFRKIFRWYVGSRN